MPTSTSRSPRRRDCTPTLQRVDTHFVYYSLASRLTHVSALGGLAEMARTGGTLTLYNVGALIRGEFAHPVLLPGGVITIVSIGRAWVRDEERDGEVRKKVGLSWSERLVADGV